MRWLSLCLCLLASTASAQVGQIYHPTFEKAPGGGGGGLAIDAFVDAFTNVAAVVLPGLTTTHTNDVIIVHWCSLVSGTPTATISDTAGLTWVQRSVTDPLGFIPVYEWYAVSPGILSGDVITVTTPGGVYNPTTAVAISGANTTTPYDVNGSIPDNGNVDPGTVSTTAANTIIFMGLRSSDATPTPGAGWTQLGTGATENNNWIWEYKIVSSAQTNLSVTIGDSGTGIGFIADAIQ